MPGGYLIALVVSFAGVMILDLRFRLALRPAPFRTIVLTLVGAGFLLIWDLVGIATGVFVKGGGPWGVGIDLAPHLPIEEPIFLLFLSYLTVVLFAAADRRLTHRAKARDEVGR